MTLTVTQANGIATVTLDRPSKKNAMSLEMMADLTRAGQELATSSARVIVIEGSGDAFCAGLDLQAMQSFATRLDAVKAEMATPIFEGANAFQAPTRGWQACPQPVIAAIEGVCFGAGLQLALAADFRIASPEARLSIMETKWGLIPDMGITTTLPILLRAVQAKDLMMTARILSGSEAAALGLVTRLAADPKVDARAMAVDLLMRAPEALAGCKRLVEEAGTGDLALEATLQADIIGAPNQMRAVAAADSGTPADYEPPKG